MADEETIPLQTKKEDSKGLKYAKSWDRFQDPPREVLPISMVESKFYKYSIKGIRLLAFLGTFCLVLCAAVISKTTLLFMTSQVSHLEPKPYCNPMDQRQFVIKLPGTEKVLWIWMLFFVYCVPQLGIFLRSFRICFFRNFELPKLGNLLVVCLGEGLSAIGSALLVYCILPELDVVKGVMLTNAFCLIPAIQDFFSGYADKSWGVISMEFSLKILALSCQVTAFFLWPVVDQKPILWTTGASILLVSLGWWQNYHKWQKILSTDSDWWKDLAVTSAQFTNSRYFIYVIASVWKCLVFFLSMIIIFWIRDEEVSYIFDEFNQALQSHPITIKEVLPILNEEFADSSAAIATGKGFEIPSNSMFPICIFLLNILSTYVCYICAKFASKIKIQKFSYAFPINLAVPVTVSVLIGISGNYIRDNCVYVDTIPNYLFFDAPALRNFLSFLSDDYVWVWLVWLLSQSWITRHIWNPRNEKGATTEKLFMRPMYDPFLIDQDLALNRRDDLKKLKIIKIRKPSIDKGRIVADDFEAGPDSKTRIYACGTMWHETPDEMMAFMKSILRLDADQSARNITKQEFDETINNDYNLLTHIFFDDAFTPTKPEGTINNYVKDLIETVDKACSEVHSVERQWPKPIKYKTPYGGRLEWVLPGGSLLVVHLKNKNKIRAKKRWSQVMYMYYLLGYRLIKNETREENTYILALDGDIDFQPSAVLLLVNKMRKNLQVGAACGRIHPIGSGPMVWFQNFEYAIGHWLQKATEHVIGCVLCSPGCFSLFRAKSLTQNNVMKKYTTKSSEARHFVQYDQGEDRWLCTLLLQSGSRVEYSAASDAYTHAPEGFNEFYNQRRRWMPSTSANIMDLLMDYKHICQQNDNISLLYIVYQAVMMIGTVLGPGTIFLMLIGAFVAAFQLDQWSSFLWNLFPILFFIVLCKWFKSDVQLFFAGLLSAIYGLVMMAVLVGVLLQIRNDGPLAPSSLFFFCVAAEMIIAAMLHPKEFGCLLYGIIYYITVPSMYLLLVIYSIFNMDNVSWGTRETAPAPGENSDKKAEKPEVKKNRIWNIFSDGNLSNSGAFEMSFAGLFKCFMCTTKSMSPEEEKLLDIRNSIERIEMQLGITESKNETDDEQKDDNNDGQVEPRGTQNESIVAEVEERNIWMDDKALEGCQTNEITDKENEFWEKFIEKYLEPDFPDEETQKKNEQNLRILRDKCVNAFLMINALYVLVVFLLTLKKDELHIKWPLDPKTNFTYYAKQTEIHIEREYLQLEPIGFVFVIFFGSLLVIQFIGMIKHRFSTLCEILADTELTFPSCQPKSTEEITSSKLKGEYAVDTIKRIQKLKPESDQEENWKRVIHLREAYELRTKEVAKDANREIPGVPRKSIYRLQKAMEQKVLPVQQTQGNGSVNLLVNNSPDVQSRTPSNDEDFDDFAKTRNVRFSDQRQTPQAVNPNFGDAENVGLDNKAYEHD